MKLVILWLVVIITFAGCNNGVNTQAEINTIRGLDRQWMDALAAKDAAAISSLYAADAIQMSANSPKVVGREAIHMWIEGWLPGQNTTSFAIDTIVISALGDIAYERGTFHFTAETPQGHTEDVGKYLTIWKKNRRRVEGRRGHGQ
ncbi:MAG: SgcJ/EcaC family oxidoreductase [bacterium]